MLVGLDDVANMDCGRAWLRKAFHCACRGKLTAFVELEAVIRKKSIDIAVDAGSIPLA
jgi:hypothetical protein